jgi:hypothetical protein
MVLQQCLNVPDQPAELFLLLAAFFLGRHEGRLGRLHTGLSLAQLSLCLAYHALSLLDLFAGALSQLLVGRPLIAQCLIEAFIDTRHQAGPQVGVRKMPGIEIKLDDARTPLRGLPAVLFFGPVVVGAEA